MPQNVSFDPNGFHQQSQQGPHSPASSGPGSPYGLPGTLYVFIVQSNILENSFYSLNIILNR